MCSCFRGTIPKPLVMCQSNTVDRYWTGETSVIWMLLYLCYYFTSAVTLPLLLVYLWWFSASTSSILAIWQWEKKNLLYIIFLLGYFLTSVYLGIIWSINSSKVRNLPPNTDDGFSYCSLPASFLSYALHCNCLSTKRHNTFFIFDIKESHRFLIY